MIELCYYYTTTGFPDLKPRCALGYKAGLWCHSSLRRHDCGRYSIEEKR